MSIEQLMGACYDAVVAHSKTIAVKGEKLPSYQFMSKQLDSMCDKHSKELTKDFVNISLHPKVRKTLIDTFIVLPSIYRNDRMACLQGALIVILMVKIILPQFDEKYAAISSYVKSNKLTNCGEQNIQLLKECSWFRKEIVDNFTMLLDDNVLDDGQILLIKSCLKKF